MTIKDLFDNLSLIENIQYKDIKLCIQDYLHYITYADDKLVEESFRSQPISYPGIPKFVYAYLAGIVELKSQQLNICCPTWVYNDCYYLDTDWFPPEIEKLECLKPILKTMSPKPFKNRKVYVSENATIVV